MLTRLSGLLLLTACLVVGDIYMHNPRGSNNRHDESSRSRRNANRLFDSQNNQRGGYNVGPFPGAVYYYSESQLTIEWANQHSCGDENNNCNVVIQYMCDTQLRDGTTTRTAPVVCNRDCDTNKAYGHHESLSYYEACSMRERNKGIFTADKNLKRKNTAKYTRQNENGNRYGYECPEERDYYPYFGHSPWRDIAIMTNNPNVCGLAQSHSQNIKSRWVCTFSNEDWDKMRGRILSRSFTDPILHWNRESCEQTTFKHRGKTYQPIWTEIPSHGIRAPECIDEQFSRDNHQGNTIGGQFLRYNWTIPPGLNGAKCTVRIRYNISTGDFDSWKTDHTSNIDKSNKKFGPAEIYEPHGISLRICRNRLNNSTDLALEEAVRRQYTLQNDPTVDVFNQSKDRRNRKRFGFKLALNTAQYGRTFQDRSHSFSIVDRPDNIPDSAKIYNLNVRGKRGNIVQVYPATEYDFVPDVLYTTSEDYVHTQWTGSDNNPGNNDGQGKRKTDRSNIVQLRRRPYAEGDLGSNLTMGTNYPPVEIRDHDLFGVSPKELRKLALAGDFKIGNTPGSTLDNGKGYFDFGLLQTGTVGKHYFFCTRNNNFSNRDQKAKVVVKN